mmetsp:Transcript_31815/g.28872  ORF Transcript_31815/g.28872 Transcript_31815/m.28872 type:complete len:101 (+) Transcript_31815:397-699(+)
MFVTSFKRFLLNFDYGYINWRADIPMSISVPNTNSKVQIHSMFPNTYALHRQDKFAISSDNSFVPINKNPQFSVKIAENFGETSLWVVLEWHSNQPNYER